MSSSSAGMNFFILGGKTFRRPSSDDLQKGRRYRGTITFAPDNKQPDSHDDARLRYVEMKDVHPEVMSWAQKGEPQELYWSKDFATFIPVPLFDEDAKEIGFETCAVCGHDDCLNFGEPILETPYVLFSCDCDACGSEYKLVFTAAGVGGKVEIPNIPKQ